MNMPSDIGMDSGDIRVLFVEDNDPDARLIEIALRDEGLDGVLVRARTLDDVRSLLPSLQPTVVVSDYRLLDYDALAVLDVVRRFDPDLPVIIVTGSLNDRLAAELQKHGARDYVLKDRTSRLAAAIRNAHLDKMLRHAVVASNLEAERAQRRQRLLTDALVDIVWTADASGALTSVSDAWETITGLPRRAATGDAWLEVIHPQDRERALATWRESLRSGRLYQSRYRLRRSDGSWRTLSVRGTPMRDWADRTIREWIGVCHDVSERMEALEALQRFRSAMDALADGVLLLDPSSMQVVDVNDTACQLFGYSREQLLEKKAHELSVLPKEDLEDTFRRLVGGDEQEARQRRELLAKHSEGRLFPVEVSRRCLRFESSRTIVTVVRDIGERKRAESGLQRLAAIVASSDDAIVSKTLDGIIESWNAAAERMFGYSAEEAIGRHISMLIPPERLGESAAILARIRAGERVKSFETVRLRKDGREVQVSLTISPIVDRAGMVVGASKILRDATEDIAHRELVEALNRVQSLVAATNVAIARIDSERGLCMEACEISVRTGKFSHAFIGMPGDGQESWSVVASSNVGSDYLDRVKQALPELLRPGGRIDRLCIQQQEPLVVTDLGNAETLHLKDEALALGSRALVWLPLVCGGQTIGAWILHANSPKRFESQETELLLALARDLSFALDRIRRKDELSFLAGHDPVTGLANVTGFLERIDQSITLAAAEGQTLAVAVLEFARLVMVNESLGQLAEDRLAQQVSQRLRAIATDPNLLSRVGPSQFAVILPVAQNARDSGRQIADHYLTCFEQPFMFEGELMHVPARAGISMFPADTQQAEALLRNAQSAVRRGATSGENVVFYDAQMTRSVADRLALESGLRRALQNNEFELHYQPKVDTETRRIEAVEALLRWNHPANGMVPPGRFITALEESGLILEVGEWVLEQAVRDRGAWEQAGLSAPRIAVNVSACQLRQPDFTARVTHALRGGGIAPGIDIEITESVVMGDVQSNIDKLKGLNAAGIAVAIDDFGTGYSSLAYLSRLPAQILKIDRAFVATMLNDAQDLSLVQTIINLAHAFGMKVVAEGVENEEQARLLRLLRCDQMQGYLLGRPVSRRAMAALLQPRRTVEAMSEAPRIATG